MRRLNGLAPGLSPTIHESGIYNTRPYILMDYIKGDTYKKYCKANICDDVNHIGCEKIKQLHTYVGILHNDLHEKNVLIGNDGIPHILDFSRATFDNMYGNTNLDSKLFGCY